MNTLRIVALSLSYIAGIVLATAYPDASASPLLLIPSACGIVLTVFLCIQEHRWREWPPLLSVGAIVLVGLPLGLYRAYGKIGTPEPGSLRHTLAQMANGTRVVCRGQVYAEPELRAHGRGNLRVAVDRIQSAVA